MIVYKVGFCKTSALVGIPPPLFPYSFLGVIPTTAKFSLPCAQTLFWRLYWRYFVFLLFALAAALPLLNLWGPPTLPAAFFIGCTVPSLGLAGLTVLTAPLLYGLLGIAAFWWARGLHLMIELASCGHISFWHFNACLCLLAAHALLLCFAAAFAMAFSYHNLKSNAQLLFSARFWHYFTVLLLLCALSLLLVPLWAELFWLPLY